MKMPEKIRITNTFERTGRFSRPRVSWTSSLGDAYYNQQSEVMDAVQVMRRRARTAGNLKTTPQQTVATQDSTIIVEPASLDFHATPLSA